MAWLANHLSHFEWVMHVAVALIIFKMIFGSLHLDLSHAITTILKEFKELVSGTVSIGALNALAIVVTTLLGAFVIVASEAKEYIEKTMAFVNPHAAAALEQSLSFATLFYCVVFIAAISLVAVVLDGRR